MTETRYIYDVQKVTTPSRTHWEVWHTVGQDQTWVHGFHEALPSHIVAAYGVDYSSATLGDEVMDIILHQSHLPDLSTMTDFSTDVAFQQGLKTKLKVDTPHHFAGTEVPINLYTADSPAQARQAHLLRIAEVKKQITYVSGIHPGSSSMKGLAATQLAGVTTDPMDNFRQGHGITADKVSQHSLIVEDQRRAMAGLDKLTPSNSQRVAPVTSPTVGGDYARRYLEIAKAENITIVPDWVKNSLSAEEISAILPTGM